MSGRGLPWQVDDAHVRAPTLWALAEELVLSAIETVVVATGETLRCVTLIGVELVMGNSAAATITMVAKITNWGSGRCMVTVSQGWNYTPIHGRYGSRGSEHTVRER